MTIQKHGSGQVLPEPDDDQPIEKTAMSPKDRAELERELEEPRK